MFLSIAEYFNPINEKVDNLEKRVLDLEKVEPNNEPTSKNMIPFKYEFVKKLKIASKIKKIQKLKKIDIDSRKKEKYFYEYIEKLKLAYEKNKNKKLLKMKLERHIFLKVKKIKLQQIKQILKVQIVKIVQEQKRILNEIKLEEVRKQQQKEKDIQDYQSFVNNLGYLQNVNLRLINHSGFTKKDFYIYSTAVLKDLFKYILKSTYPWDTTGQLQEYMINPVRTNPNYVRNGDKEVYRIEDFKFFSLAPLLDELIKERLEKEKL
jgi:hypothetical protein